MKQKKILKLIKKQLNQNLDDIINIEIKITEQYTHKKDQNETQIYIGTIKTTTKNQTYNGTFTLKTYYQPLIQNKYITTNGILKEIKELNINQKEEENK